MARNEFDKRLSDRWDTDKDRKASNRDELDTRNRYHYDEESFYQRNRGTVKDIDEMMDRLDFIMSDRYDMDMDAKFAESLLDVNDIRPRSDPDSRLDRIEKQLDELLKNNIRDAEPAEKQSSVRRWILAAIGLLVAGGLGFAVYEIMRRQAKGEGDSDIDVPAALKAKLQELIDKWNAAPDPTFWLDFANAIDAGLVIDGKQQQFTIADQVVFLNLTIATCPLKELWLWDSAKDVESNAEAIKKYFDASKKVSDIYRNVMEVKYQGKSMPRAVAAKQLQMVLSWILAGEQE